MCMTHKFQKEMSGCSLFGLMSENGRQITGNDAKKAITIMHDRSNGLGGGFAAYGIYPKEAEYYAFHLMYDNEEVKQKTEEHLELNYNIQKEEKIPTQSTETIKKHPLLWRYFVEVKEDRPDLKIEELSEEDFIVKTVMSINVNIKGAYLFSSGKNMGIFKGVGFPEDIADFFKIEDYRGHTWTAHGRFPTNTPGWWGGAHPFGLLDWSVVHNGEISSYGINKRYLEMFGYNCTLYTDTEVMIYLFDLLTRRHKIPLKLACDILASPFWKDIDKMKPEEKKLHTTMRTIYGSALVNGPFAVILGHKAGMVAINDRIKLRPLVAARKDDMLYVSSEECAIREVCSNPEKVWSPRAGEPIIGEIKT